jgi:hypothetical protein
MTDGKKADVLKGLAQTLVSVENNLLHRKVDRDSETLDDFYSGINDLADNGTIDIDHGNDENSDIDSDDIDLDIEDDGDEEVD